VAKKNWEKAEIGIARAINGKRTPGSGNGFLEGDISTKNMLVEVKETSRPFLTFRLSWLKKIIEEANRAKKIPVFGIEFFDKTQKFLVRVKDLESYTQLSILDLTNNLTVSFRGEFLEDNTLLRTIYGDWLVVDIDVIKTISCY
jgi:hypothetical protein